MSNKKLVLSVAVTAAVASTLVTPNSAAAEAYRVKSGDSLWSIAHQYNTSVQTLKSINGLSGDLIFPNQVLETTPSHSNPSTKPNTKPNAKPDKKPAAKPTTYIVKRGDTLSGIANEHNISLSDLMKWNNLNSTLIYPGNKFVVSKSGDSSQGKPETTVPESDSNSQNGSTANPAPSKHANSVYTVKSGDTLSAIAKANRVTVSDLKTWNNLKSDLILIGQKLNIGSKKAPDNATDSTVENTPPSDIDYNVDKLLSVANSMTGVPYKWGGSTPGGFDCSGFIHYAYNQAGKSISRLSAASYHSRAFYVDTPKVGDLVFFKNTYKQGISHMGIYIGNNKFIHAGSSKGVQIADVNSRYWQKHFDSFKRFY
ncbi:putative peptidoglycan endopeptidase LytE [Lentibacillus sp. JNUCC-1]|uniref:C40 family peptidase n=1 Tax=Lentibacillus sp. JNUCC-1 TaxID=2654513 RepID=UPI0012E7D3B9|nr:peptidoglycan endopeptidase [Lentibacillus sp. JNUCC-1]MUV36853.1 putative peptidoglycan endopeptidase LytE [Lentibacillus sp. JNUCC-1]